jgi:hypothetical protein
MRDTEQVPVAPHARWPVGLGHEQQISVADVRR